MPLVDATLLEALAPAMGGLTPGAGKTALAKAPSSLPNEIVTRAKTGFGVHARLDGHGRRSPGCC
jgi:asparagine synthase (glutamine-hydrolysing)